MQALLNLLPYLGGIAVVYLLGLIAIQAVFKSPEDSWRLSTFILIVGLVGTFLVGSALPVISEDGFIDFMVKGLIASIATACAMGLVHIFFGPRLSSQ